MSTALGHHASYALPLEFLDIVVIEDSKPMQTLFRSMLAAFHPRRIRMYDSFQSALQGMVNEPPTLVITDWRVGRLSAFRFLKMVRARAMSPLCFTSVMIVTAHATQQVVEKAMTAGAHMVLVKPISPTMLTDRITRLTRDGRRFVLHPDGCYAIEGVDGKLAEIQTKTETLQRARAYQQKISGLVSPQPVRKAVALPPVLREPIDLPVPMAPVAAAPPVPAPVASPPAPAPAAAAFVPAPATPTAPPAEENIFAAPSTSTPRMVRRKPVKGWGAVAKA